MEDDNEDMDLDFNPFDSTFENFEEFDSHDVESLAKELHFYEEKAEFLAGQGALEGFSISRDAFSMQHDYFSEDVGHLDASIQAQRGASPSELDLHFADQSLRSFSEGKKQLGAGPSKSAEDQGVQRTNSSGSLKRTLSEQAGYSGAAHSEEAHSRGFRGLGFGQEMHAVESDVFGRSSDAFGRGSDAFGQSSDAFGQSSDAFGQAHERGSNGLGQRPDHDDEGQPPGSQLHPLAPLEDSLLGSQIEPRAGEAPASFSNDDDALFRFDTDSKPFDFGAALFGHLPNGATALPGLESDSPQELAGRGEGGSGGLLEPGLLTTEEANEITKANMWVSSDGDDRPIGSLKEAKSAKKAGSSGKRSSRKRSAAAITKKMDPVEAARLEKNRIKAQRHRDKMKAWKEDVKLENEDLRAQRAKLAEEREELAVGKASLEREKNEMEKTMSRLQQEVSRLQSENARLWKENQELSEAAQAGQRQADTKLLREPSGEEGPHVAELQKLNDRLKEQNGKLEEELAVVKGAFAAQLHTMSNLVAIRPPGRDDEG